MSTEQIWEKFSDQIYRFILSKVNDEQTASDIQQEVFIKIHLNIDSLKHQDALAGWLFTVTRNAIMDHFRNRKRDRKNQNVLENNIEAIDGVESELEKCCLGCLHLFIEDLPKKYRDAILATDLGTFSQKNYAEKIGISYSGLKSRVQRGREMLNDHFKNCCLAKNEYGESLCQHKESHACIC